MNLRNCLRTVSGAYFYGSAECEGEFCDELNKADLEGDPDKLIKPIKNTLSYIPWLDSETAQVMATFTELNGDPNLSDQSILIGALDALKSLKLKMVVATDSNSI